MNANIRFRLIKEKLLDHLRWIMKRYEEKNKKTLPMDNFRPSMEIKMAPSYRWIRSFALANPGLHDLR